jgi:hypothetical protein
MRPPEGSLEKWEGVRCDATIDQAGCAKSRSTSPGSESESTASSSSKDGGKQTFVDFDESHLCFTPEFRRMYSTVRRNTRKRMKTAETWSLETTTMYAGPGVDCGADVQAR